MSSSRGGDGQGGPEPPAGRFRIALETCVPADPERAFEPIERIGGRRGWHSPRILWQIRGILDLLAGGPGMGRGRRDPESLCPGDALDCWRVAGLERNRFLLLEAEMKLPGRGWLEFRVIPDGSAGSLLRQTAIFDPRGPFGTVYWWVLYPVHRLMFGSMLRGLARDASQTPPQSSR